MRVVFPTPLQKTYDTIFQLVGQLSEEALRRTELTIEAERARLDQEFEAEHAPHARKEGV